MQYRLIPLQQFCLTYDGRTQNRQNSIDDVEQQTKYYEQRIDDHFRESVKLYESMLHSGIAKVCTLSGTIEYCDQIVYIWHIT